ncbi:Lsr2 [Gordonia bronchialis]|uniref:histone-like nucleoid-structuring protein Lsr2 n=1 Tax=Gordonia bronchialis TaxID=2054 RepID=UPI000A063A56|nr:Lsr2 family protein [Gordonia bronchialis]UAK37774.1 Lsr2 family protein [Gordonia bronchialis]STQ63172.1 Lsr2 [Gordonia bronchialis]
MSAGAVRDTICAIANRYSESEKSDLTRRTDGRSTVSPRSSVNVDAWQIQKVTFVDDLDGHQIDSDDAHTVSWSWLGVDYELDVSTANLNKVENGKVTVAKLLDVSTRVGGRKRPTAARTASAPSTSSKSGSPTTEIREWAIGAGYDVAPRGRLPQNIIEAYEAAH